MTGVEAWVVWVVRHNAMRDSPLLRTVARRLVPSPSPLPARPG